MQSSSFELNGAEYMLFRPSYPTELIQSLSSLTPLRRLAWDCACGNGQVSKLLVNYFERVYATDRSADQIANTVICDRVSYAVELAEQSSLLDASVDLITVAAAFHWFNQELFMREVKRVLQPDGVIAIWTYRADYPICSDISEFLHELCWEILGDYWSSKLQIARDGYKDILFPFEDVEVPQFHMAHSMTCAQFQGYIETLSASKYFKLQNGYSVLNIINSKLEKAWGDLAQQKVLEWPILLRVGRNYS